MRTFFLILFAVITSVAITAFSFLRSVPASVKVTTHVALGSAKAVDVKDIARRADDVPPPIIRSEPALVEFALETKEVVAEIAPGISYEYWTYNGTVPGPFLRVREGDSVEVRLTHATHGHAEDTHSLNFAIGPVLPADAAGDHDAGDESDGHGGSDAADAHSAAGHGTHSIDLHAVIGPGGGAALMQVTSGETRSFRFKATRPGLYVYHCASPHIPTHIANGMYGMILVEPAGGMAKVDREFYVMQGELYTAGALNEKGHHPFSKEKLLAGQPTYAVFNGRVGALRSGNALKAKAGEKIRVYAGVGSFMTSNFHVIGGILDSVYPEGDIISPPHKNVQTTLIPAGGAIMTEFILDVPGTYLLVDHNLPYAVDRGAIAELIVDGPQRPDLFGGSN